MCTTVQWREDKFKSGGSFLRTFHTMTVVSCTRRHVHLFQRELDIVKPCLVLLVMIESKFNVSHVGVITSARISSSKHDTRAKNVLLLDPYHACRSSLTLRERYSRSQTQTSSLVCASLVQYLPTMDLEERTAYKRNTSTERAFNHRPYSIFCETPSTCHSDVYCSS